MAKEEFLQSVRDAVGTLLPRVDGDHPYTDRQELAGILRRSGLWLSRSAVAGFNREDFEGLDTDARDSLNRNVLAFLDVASKVNPKKPATPDQVDAALQPFLEGSQMALIPVGRFMMSSKGSFDLAVMPAYESVMVRRGSSSKWTIDPLPGEKRVHRWNSKPFVEVSEKLARMG